MILHVDAFSTLGFDGVGSDAFCTFIVAQHNSG